MPSSFLAASVFQVVLTPPNVLGSITAFAPQNPWDSRGCQLLMLHKDLVICSIQSSLLLIKAFYLLPSLLENHKVFTYSLLQLKGFFFFNTKNLFRSSSLNGYHLSKFSIPTFLRFGNIASFSYFHPHYHPGQVTSLENNKVIM